MKERTKYVLGRTYIVLLIIILLFIGIAKIVHIPKFPLHILDEDWIASMEFCESQGYESQTLKGQYNEKFGKVTCMSCYMDDCIEEEFNVTKDFLGYLHIK